jgi:hypothetical protein
VRTLISMLPRTLLYKYMERKGERGGGGRVVAEESPSSLLSFLSSSAFCYSKRGQRTLDGYKLRPQEPPSFCADDDEPIVALTL